MKPPPTERRFHVHGSRLAVVATPTGWRVDVLGADGKRGASDVVIPDFIEGDELLQYLGDLFHESARPRSGGVYELP